MVGIKMIKWNENTRELILATRQKLVNEGMSRPAIRTTLYRLMNLPPWAKRHYDTLCVKLGEWRDGGIIPFGLFADDGGGTGYTPLTSKKITETIQKLRDTIPARLGPDGYLHAVFIEHADLVDDVARWLDYEVAIVSSQGQLRREHLYSRVVEWLNVVKTLGGKGVKCIAIVDYDKAGKNIYDAHRNWLKKQFDIDLKFWGVTMEQVREAGLPTHEDHQWDGWIGAYGPKRFRKELRKAVGLK